MYVDPAVLNAATGQQEEVEEEEDEEAEEESEKEENDNEVIGGGLFTSACQYLPVTAQLQGVESIGPTNSDKFCAKHPLQRHLPALSLWPAN